MKRALILLGIAMAAWLVFQSMRVPNYWRTADQRGESLLRAGKFEEAAKQFGDPARIGEAQYRAGDFEASAKTFARVPGAVGAYNQGNAWLMNGKYDRAIASFDRALGFKPGWQEAVDNKALAAARKAAMEASGENRADEQANAYEPDDVVMDQKGEDRGGKDVELAAGDVSDDQLRATWLRQVQTTPGDFLRAKFAYEESQPKKADGAKGATP